MTTKEQNGRRNTLIRLLGWTEEEINKLDDINVNWMMLDEDV